MATKSNRCFTYASAILIELLSGRISSNTVTLSIPFSYEGFGVGGNGIDFALAVQFGTWFAFLVAPINFYYFGIKPVGEA